MSVTTRESVFILLKVIKRHEQKRPEGRTKLTKFKTIISLFVLLNRKQPYLISFNWFYLFELVLIGKIGFIFKSVYVMLIPNRFIYLFV